MRSPSRPPNRQGEDPVGLDDVAASADDGPPADDLLTALVGRRFGARMAAGDAGAERRAGAFLARRGHDWQTIRRVLAVVKRAEIGGGLGRGVQGPFLDTFRTAAIHSLGL